MTGTVVSNKMTNALVVAVKGSNIHTKYHKRYQTKKNYSAACSDSNKFHIGQTVEIEKCRPISKTIKFKVVE